MGSSRQLGPYSCQLSMIPAPPMIRESAQRLILRLTKGGNGRPRYPVPERRQHDESEQRELQLCSIRFAHAPCSLSACCGKSEEHCLNKSLAPNRRRGVVGRMGFGPATCLSHLLRDKLDLILECQCGHVATPDIVALRSAMWRARRGEELRDLHRTLKCSKCGEKRFIYRLRSQGSEVRSTASGRS